MSAIQSPVCNAPIQPAIIGVCWNYTCSDVCEASINKKNIFSQNVGDEWNTELL